MLQRKRRVFSDLAIGQSVETLRFVTSEDVEAFARVSRDYNPLHLDETYVATTPFRSRVAHGALVASFISGLIGMELPGPGSVAVSLNLKFRKPVYVNSTVVTRVEIIGLDRRRSFVKLACCCFVEGNVTIKGEALVGAYTDQQIVDHINAMGYRSKKQHMWAKSGTKIIGQRGEVELTIKQLQKIIQRPIYAGINTEKWLKTPIKTKYNGLVSISTFNNANKGKLFIEEQKDGSIFIHKDYNPHQLKRMKDNPLFPFKEVILCPECQKPFLGSSSTGKSGKSFPAYHCARKHKHYRIPKKEFEEKISILVNKLKRKDGGFLKALEVTLMNKYREKEKELGEFSVMVGVTVSELEIEKQQKIKAYTSTTNEIIRIELDKQITEIHQRIEKTREQRNGVEVRENDIHSFVGYIKYLMEHPVKLLVKQKNLPLLKALYGLVFDELPTYAEVVNGTPKLSIPYKLSDEFKDNKSLSVTPQRIEL